MRLALCLLIAAGPALSQSIDLAEPSFGASDITARVGDTLTVQVSLDAGGLPASGLAVHLRLPAEGLAVVDPLDGSGRPFRPLAMFAGAVEFANERVDLPLGLPPGWDLLSYAVVLGPGDRGQRSRSGSGPVARFDLVCTAPVAAAEVGLVSNPVHESQIVLADGRSARPLRAGSSLLITVLEPAARPVAGSWAAVKGRLALD